MSDEHDPNDFALAYDRDRKIMKIEGGSPDMLQSMIIDLVKEDKVPNDMRAILFTGASPKLITGDSLVLYLMGADDEKKEKPPSFSDILKKQRNT